MVFRRRGLPQKAEPTTDVCVTVRIHVTSVYRARACVNVCVRACQLHAAVVSKPFAHWLRAPRRRCVRALCSRVSGSSIALAGHGSRSSLFQSILLTGHWLAIVSLPEHFAYRSVAQGRRCVLAFRSRATAPGRRCVSIRVFCSLATGPRHCVCVKAFRLLVIVVVVS